MPENQAEININELNQVATESLIHFNPQRVDYAINENELNALQELGKSLSKEFFFASVGISIPTIINAIIAHNKINTQNPSYWEFVYNLIPGAVFAILSIFFLINWRKEEKRRTDIIVQIKSRPKFRLPGAPVPASPE